MVQPPSTVEEQPKVRRAHVIAVWASCTLLGGLLLALPDDGPRLLSFSRKYPNLDVMDPYYGGPQGFEENLDMIEDAVQGLIREITGGNQVKMRSGH